MTNKQVAIRELRIFCLRHHVKFSESLLIDIYDSAWLASRHNPSWGPRLLVTCKLISVQPKESWFDRKVVYVNTNGSIDVGVMQINTCNWFATSWWPLFCAQEGYNPKKFNLLFNRYFNVEYAAWLNERLIKTSSWQFKYYEKPEQCELYDALIKALGIECLAEKFNDGQYKSKKEK